MIQIAPTLRTNNEFVTRVLNDFKALTKDGRMSRRHIVKIGMDKARYLMSQKLDEMTLFKEDGLIIPIDCFEMCEQKPSECDIFELRACNRVMVSREPIPDGLFGKNGSGIIFLSNIDGSKRYEYKTSNEYFNHKRRGYVTDSVLPYLIKGCRLYIPDSDVEVVRMEMIALKPWEVDSVNSCCKNNDECKSYMDYPFICPDRFYEVVVRDTITELSNTYARTIEDTNPNMDENLKTKTNN